jgi:AraC-like DNA-binding protein
MVTLDQAGWARERLVITRPPAELAHLVELFWIDERHRLPRSFVGWRIVADDAPHIIYCRYSDPGAKTDRHRLHIVGARNRYADVDCTNRLFTVGARFRAGAIPALFGAPAHELTNRSLSADLLVRSGAEVLSRFTDDCPRSAHGQIVRFIRELVSCGGPVDVRAHSLARLRPHAATSVLRYAQQLGVTDRAVRSWSAQHLGIGLKRYLNIRRLHGAIETRLSTPNATWSRIAAANGFADQSHLVRDCRDMLGESPSEFLARAG